MTAHNEQPYYTPAPAGNPLATAGFVLGLLGLVLCWLGVVGWLLALLGIIFSALGIAKSKRVGKGKGLAITGLVLGIVGIVIGVVLVMFVAASLEYMSKGKRSDADLQLDRIAQKVKSYHLAKAALPPSALAVLPGGDGAACSGAGNGKIAVVPQSTWQADPGWGAMYFSIDEDSYFSYHWQQTSPTTGHALAVGDLDCDGTLSTYRLDIQVVDGNVRVERQPPTAD